MALSADRLVDQIDVDTVIPQILSFPVGASKTIYAGGLVMTVDGYARAATDGYGISATTIKVWGRCEVGTSTAGAVQVTVRPGIFALDNDTGSAVGLAHVGGKCYAKDDITVSASSTGSDAASRKVAGTVIGLRADGKVIVAVVPTAD
jgi:hypothetical protein